MSKHLEVVCALTMSSPGSGSDRLNEVDASAGRAADAEWDAEVFVWESYPGPIVGTNKTLRELVSSSNSVVSTGSKFSMYFPQRNAHYQRLSDDEIKRINAFLNDTSVRESAIVNNEWFPRVAFWFKNISGCGKSELVRNFCHETQTNYRFIAWIDASSAESIISSYQRCIAVIKHVDITYLSSAVAKEAKNAVDLVCAWLERYQAPWLLVIDDIIDPPLQSPESSSSPPSSQMSDAGIFSALSRMIPSRCAPRVMGHVLVTAREDRRAEWHSAAPSRLYSPGDPRAVMLIKDKLTVQTVELLFLEYLVKRGEEGVSAQSVSPEILRYRETYREALERDVVAHGMELATALSLSALAIVQALSLIRHMRRVHEWNNSPDPPGVVSFLTWMKESCGTIPADKLPPKSDESAVCRSAITCVSVITKPMLGGRPSALRRILECVAFLSPNRIDAGLLELFLRPPFSGITVRVLGKWRLPTLALTFSVAARLQEAEFEFEVESVMPCVVTVCGSKPRFKWRIYRNYASIREAHEEMQKLYCPAAAKLRFPSALLAIPADGNAEDAVSFRRAELANFFRELSSCPCWGALCGCPALLLLFGITIPTDDALSVAALARTQQRLDSGSARMSYPVDPMNMLIECSPEFVRLADPLFSCGLLSLSFTEQILPSEEAPQTAGIVGLLSSAVPGILNSRGGERVNRRLEFSVNRNTQTALLLRMQLENSVEAKVEEVCSFLSSILDVKTEQKVLFSEKYCMHSVLPHALRLIQDFPADSASFLQLCECSYSRCMASLDVLSLGAELACVAALDVIKRRAPSRADGPGSLLEADWQARHGELSRLTGRREQARQQYEQSLRTYRKQSWRGCDNQLMAVTRSLGKLYFEDNRTKQAEKLLEELVEKSRILNAENPTQLANDLSDYASVLSQSSFDAATLQQGLALKQEQLQLVVSVHGKASVPYAVCCSEVGEYERRCGKDSSAGQWFEDAMDVLVALGKADEQEMISPLYNMAMIYHSDKRLTDAEALYHKALEIDASVFGANSERSAELHESLGILLCDKLEFEQGLEHLRAASDLYTRKFGGQSREVVLADNSLAYAYHKMGDSHLSSTMYEKSLDTLRQNNNRKDDEVVAQTLNALGEVYVSLGRFAEARQLFVECFGMRMNILGEQHESVASVMKNLSTVAFALDSLVEAKEMAEGALRILVNIYGDAPSEPVAPLMADIGEILLKMGEIADARQYLEDAIRVRISLSGNEDYRMGKMLQNYGSVLMESGSFEESLSSFTEALAILKSHYGANSADAASCMFDFATAKIKCERYSEAKRLLEDCLAVRQRVFSANSEEVARTLFALAQLYKVQGDIASARQAAEACVEVRVKLYGMHGGHVASALDLVAKITLVQGHLDEALRLFRDELKMLESDLTIYDSGVDATDPSKRLTGKTKAGAVKAISRLLGNALHQIGTILSELGSFEEATQMLEKCLQLRREILSEEHEDVATTLHSIAHISFRMEMFTEAFEIHSIGRAIRRKLFGEDDPRTVSSDSFLAACMLALGRFEEAKDAFESCVLRLRNRFGDESLHVAAALHRLSAVFLITKDIDHAAVIENKALDILVALNGRSHASVADAYCAMGDICKLQGNAHEAKTNYTRVLEIEKAIEKAFSGSTSSRDSRWKNPESRVRYYSISLEHALNGEDLAMWSGAFDTHDKQVLRLTGVYERMMWALDNSNRRAEADAFAEEALSLNVATFGQNDVRIAYLLRVLGVRFRSRGEYSSAVPFFEKAVWLQEEHLRDKDSQNVFLVNVADFRSNLNDLLWLLVKTGDDAGAASVQEKISLWSSRRAKGAAASGDQPVRSSVSSASSVNSAGATHRAPEARSAAADPAPHEQIDDSRSERKGGVFSFLSNLSLFTSNNTE